MGATGGEDGLEPSTYTASLKVEERRHHHEGDKVLDPRTGTAAGVASCVGMNLFGDMLLQGQRRDFRRGDIGEAQQLRSAHQFGGSDGWVPAADVNCHILT